jgi:hypothetical protein
MHRICAWCGKTLVKANFYHYVVEVLKLGDDKRIPFFCKEKCMILYVSYRLRKSKKEVERNYKNYQY